jgi:hypothetical protein
MVAGARFIALKVLESYTVPANALHRLLEGNFVTQGRFRARLAKSVRWQKKWSVPGSVLAPGVHVPVPIWIAIHRKVHASITRPAPNAAAMEVVLRQVLFLMQLAHAASVLRVPFTMRPVTHAANSAHHANLGTALHVNPCAPIFRILFVIQLYYQGTRFLTNVNVIPGPFGIRWVPVVFTRAVLREHVQQGMFADQIHAVFQMDAPLVAPIPNHAIQPGNVYASRELGVMAINAGMMRAQGLWMDAVLVQLTIHVIRIHSNACVRRVYVLRDTLAEMIHAGIRISAVNVPANIVTRIFNARVSPEYVLWDMTAGRIHAGLVSSTGIRIVPHVR